MKYTKKILSAQKIMCNKELNIRINATMCKILHANFLQ